MAQRSRKSQRYLLHFPDRSRSITARHGATLLSLILKEGLPIGHSCLGLGTCGACIVEAGGDLSPRTTRESNTLSARSALDHERLACLCSIEGEAWVRSIHWRIR